MRKIFLLAAVLLLTGCATSKPIETISDKYHVVIAPSSLYNCPQITVFPEVETLTDLQTAKLLVKYAENNAICSSSLEAIRRFYEEAKAKFES